MSKKPREFRAPRTDHKHIKPYDRRKSSLTPDEKALAMMHRVDGLKPGEALRTKEDPKKALVLVQRGMAEAVIQPSGSAVHVRTDKQMNERATTNVVTNLRACFTEDVLKELGMKKAV